MASGATQFTVVPPLSWPVDALPVYPGALHGDVRDGMRLRPVAEAQEGRRGRVEGLLLLAAARLAIRTRMQAVTLFLCTSIPQHRSITCSMAAPSCCAASAGASSLTTSLLGVLGGNKAGPGSSHVIFPADSGCHSGSTMTDTPSRRMKLDSAILVRYCMDIWTFSILSGAAQARLMK